MKIFYLILFASIVMVACQPNTQCDNSVNETFEKNSKTVMSYLDGFQNEKVDYASIFADDFVEAGTQFGSKDSFSLAEMIENDKKGWSKYEFELLDSIVFLPGVNQDSKKMDGSVRYYGDWKVTLSKTDSTDAKSGIIKAYESYDFDSTGKVIYHQFYGDGGGLFNYLFSSDEE